MKLRFLFLTAVLLVVALPAAAQYPSCVQCLQTETSDGMHYQFCGTPENNSWGGEKCEFRTIGNVQYCRTVGTGCYYIEVNG